MNTFRLIMVLIVAVVVNGFFAFRIMELEGHASEWEFKLRLLQGKNEELQSELANKNRHYNLLVAESQREINHWKKAWVEESQIRYKLTCKLCQIEWEQKQEQRRNHERLSRLP